MTERELVWLATAALGCDRIVEFGCFHGRSTRALADNCSDKTKIWAVDPWNGDYFTESGENLRTINSFVLPIFRENLKDHILSGKVIPVHKFSTSFSLPFEVDMVFIDGDHRYETVKKDIHKAMSLVRVGGIISGHDYGHPMWTGVKKASDELLGSVNIEDTIWWIQKS